MKSVTQDLISHHETHLQISNIMYNQNIPSELFSKKYLEDPEREKKIIKHLLQKQLGK